jgi:hypothetical protein
MGWIFGLVLTLRFFKRATTHRKTALGKMLYPFAAILEPAPSAE